MTGSALVYFFAENLFSHKRAPGERNSVCKDAALRKDRLTQNFL